MACYIKIKEDLKLLEELFTKQHPIFQINSGTVDDLKFTFKPAEDTSIIIHANITVSGELTDYSYSNFH